MGSASQTEEYIPNEAANDRDGASKCLDTLGAMVLQPEEDFHHT